jgi:hypothetical protein
MKRCSRCRVEKGEKEFNKSNNNKDGLQRNCRKCQSELHKISLAKGRDRLLALRREYYRKNKDKYKKYNREHADIRRKYLKDNRDKILERTRKYVKANSDKIKKNRKEYELKNREKINKRTRKYWEAHKTEKKELGKKYRGKYKEIIKAKKAKSRVKHPEWEANRFFKDVGIVKGNVSKDLVELKTFHIMLVREIRKRKEASK